MKKPIRYPRNVNRLNILCKIQGPYCDHDEVYLYWSNNDGWVPLNDSTTFSRIELERLNLPMESTHIAFIDKNEEIIRTETIRIKVS